MTFFMRNECCGQTQGQIETRNGQDLVLCAVCGRWQYNAPRLETGREPRNHRTRSALKPGIRSRVLERDGYTCTVCHRSDVELDVGHILSVDDGKELGVPDRDIDSEDNLAAMCTPCNSGQGRRSLPPWLVYRLIQARSLKASASP